jgi:type IV pilus assembly protein PilZ
MRMPPEEPKMGAVPGATGGVPRQGILSLAIKDKGALYNAYMSFVKGGGLFVPTTKRYNLGDEVFILLSLMDDKDRLPVAGKVVWITPPGAQGNRTAGIGVNSRHRSRTVKKRSRRCSPAARVGQAHPPCNAQPAQQAIRSRDHRAPSTTTSSSNFTRNFCGVARPPGRSARVGEGAAGPEQAGAGSIRCAARL